MKWAGVVASLLVVGCSADRKAQDLDCATTLYRGFSIGWKSGAPTSIVAEQREATFFYLGRLSGSDRTKNWLNEVRLRASRPDPQGDEGAMKRNDLCIRAMSQLMGDEPRPMVQL